MPGNEIIGKEELKEITTIFKKGGVLFFSGFKKKRKNYFAVKKFEKQIKSYFNCRYSVAVSSGTAGLKIALKALGVKTGDEVITQAFNFVATIEAILDIGAKPIIVNVNDNLNIDLNDLEKKISSKTKVILPVHMLGYSTDIAKIKKIAKKKNIKVLEDNCETIGGKYNNKYLGTHGDVGVLSLDYNKTITTGEGGLILTNNSKYYNYCKEYSDHGHLNIKNLPRGRDKAKIYGFNYRLTELQAAVGLAQIKKLNEILNKNKKRYLTLELNFIKKKNIRKIIKNSIPNYEVFIFEEKNKIKKNKILKILKKNKINSKVLPGAIEWHCAFYWQRCIGDKYLNYDKTKRILNQKIAIPVLLNKSLSFYKNLIKEINKIYES